MNELFYLCQPQKNICSRSVDRRVFLQREPVDTLTVFSCMNSYCFILNMILTQFVFAFSFFTFFFELVYELIVKDFCFLVLVNLFLVL